MSNEFKRTPTCGENDVDLRVATEPRRATDAVLSQIIAAKDGEIAALTAEVARMAAALDAGGTSADRNSALHAARGACLATAADKSPEYSVACYARAQAIQELIWDASPQPVAAAQAVPSLPTANGRPIETDAAHRLRLHATNANLSQDLRKALTSGADECDRYYGGMMAWKKTAEKKDADWNAERMARVDERCASRLATAAAQAVPEALVSAAGRALADRSAASCNVDKDDNWKFYGNEFIEDARVAFKAAGLTVAQPTDTTKGA